jgi:hypothetical protein
VAAGVAAAGYAGLVTGACPLDLGVGRRTRPLGPRRVDVTAPPEVVFDVIAEPYLGRTPRALAGKLRVLERGGGMVLAAHCTPLGGRLGLVAQTVETVRVTQPDRVDFRLVRGPAPYVVEAFVLTEQPDGAGTRLAWQGELAADLWRLGQWWGGAGRAAVGADGRRVAGGGQGGGRTARGRCGTPTVPPTGGKRVARPDRSPGQPRADWYRRQRRGGVEARQPTSSSGHTCTATYPPSRLGCRWES